MLLLWYTPPRQTGYTTAQYQARLQRDYRIRDDEFTLLSLWWMLNRFEQPSIIEQGEQNNG